MLSAWFRYSHLESMKLLTIWVTCLILFRIEYTSVLIFFAPTNSLLLLPSVVSPC